MLKQLILHSDSTVVRCNFCKRNFSIAFFSFNLNFSCLALKNLITDYIENDLNQYKKQIEQTVVQLKIITKERARKT